MTKDSKADEGISMLEKGSVKDILETFVKSNWSEGKLNLWLNIKQTLLFESIADSLDSIADGLANIDYELSGIKKELVK